MITGLEQDIKHLKDASTGHSEQIWYLNKSIDKILGLIQSMKEILSSTIDNVEKLNESKNNQEGSEAENN